MFINREKELTVLNGLLAQDVAQFVMVYGRRRVGKTTLLNEWAKRTGLSTFYWVAKRDPRELQMASLAQAIFAWQQGVEFSDVEMRPGSWESVFRQLAQAIGQQRVIVILDELPYILQQDSGFGTHLQAAWDHLFKSTQVVFLISGSHIGMLTALTEYHAPLYGRLTAQFPLDPLTFSESRAFLPHYDAQQRLAAHAVLGGVPAYLERWRSQETIASNIEKLFLQRTSWFRTEPLVLISDLTQRETAVYEAILRAIADGKHGREEIAKAAAVKSPSLSHYFERLLALRLLERRIPATVPLNKLKNSKQTRYFLRDPFLRFYYRFVDQNLHLIERGLARRLWQMMGDNFRAFVAYSFEEIAYEWVIHQANQGILPFLPDNVGQHWSKTVQVDVVAIAWREKQLLLGECTWGDRPLGRSVVSELVERKTPRVLANLPDGGEGWTIHYALFARSEFTEPARQSAEQHEMWLLTLEQLDVDLRSV